MNKDAEVMSEVSEEQLREMLVAYAGPERPQPRSRPRRSWRVFAVLAAAVPALAALIAVAVYDPLSGGRSDAGRSDGGGLTSVDGSTLRGIPFRIPIDEMITSSDLIFVGTVTAIYGPEELSPANPPDYLGPILAYRVSYQVERLLRGNQAEEIELTNTMGRGAAFSAKVGEAYLVFAAWEEVGYERVPRLVAVGIDQGVFHVTGPHSAENAREVIVDPDEVAQRVRHAGAG